MPTIEIPNFWIVRAACSCPIGSMTADRLPLEILATEHQAWESFYTRKREREAARKKGVYITREDEFPMERWKAGHAHADCTLNETSKPVPRPEPAAPTTEAIDIARDIVITTQYGSKSLLQRRMKIGFTASTQLMEALEKEGVVGPAQGSTHPVLVLPPRKPPVHNHGPSQGRGLDCGEYRDAEGFLRGHCMDAAERA